MATLLHLNGGQPRPADSPFAMRAVIPCLRGFPLTDHFPEEGFSTDFS